MRPSRFFIGAFFLCALSVFALSVSASPPPKHSKAPAGSKAAPVDGPMCGYCPPYYCYDPALGKKLKAQKKAQMRADGLPARLMAFVDRLDDCEACIQTSPDWIHIQYEYDTDAYRKKFGRKPPFTSESEPWSADLEKKVRDDVRAGLIKKFALVHYSDKPCKCCHAQTEEQYTAWHDATEVPDEESPGYDTENGYHPDGAQGFDKTNMGDDPPDLTEIPPAFQKPDKRNMPPVEKFMDNITSKVVHTYCPACQKYADEYNRYGEMIDDMRKEIADARRNNWFDRQTIRYTERALRGTEMMASGEKTDSTVSGLNHDLDLYKEQYKMSQKKLNDLIAERQRYIDRQAAQLKLLIDCQKQCDPKESMTAPPPEDHAQAEPTPGVNKAQDGKCSPPPAPQALTIGPNSQYGTGAAMKDKATGMARSMATGALMGAIGGGHGLLGGHSEDNDGIGSPGGGSGAPKTDRDPTRGDFARIADNDIDLGVRVMAEDDDHILVSQKIFDAPGDGTFHTMFLQDGAGHIVMPTNYYIYSLYQDWKLSVWWTHDKWVDGEHVYHDEGSKVTTGRNDLGSWMRYYDGEEGVQNSIWANMGFKNAAKGINGLGAEFDISKLDLSCPLTLSTYITEPKKDPVPAVPVDVQMSRTKVPNTKDEILWVVIR